MARMVDRWLELAEQLLVDRPRSSGLRRRAVSSAYYAIFHAIAKICADEIAGALSRTSTAYQRVYRSLGHEAVRKAFMESPLAGAADLKIIGESFTRLQSERIKADYMPPILDVITLSTAKELLTESRKTLDRLHKLTDANRQMLVVYLLVKDPKR